MPSLVWQWAWQSAGWQPPPNVWLPAFNLHSVKPPPLALTGKATTGQEIVKQRQSSWPFLTTTPFQLLPNFHPEKAGRLGWRDGVRRDCGGENGLCGGPAARRLARDLSPQQVALPALPPPASRVPLPAL